MSKKLPTIKDVCPFCGKTPYDVTDLLVSKVRDSSVLMRCDDCEFLWGRTT